MKNDQIDAYEKHMQRIWDVKDALYQTFTKSGYKTYVEFIQAQSKSTNNSYYIDQFKLQKIV